MPLKPAERRASAGTAWAEGHSPTPNKASGLRGDRLGLADNWLRHVRDVSEKHAAQLVFVGISIALIGGMGYESADDWAALLACAVILFNGYRIFRAALNEIMDAAAPGPLQKGIREIASAVPGVVRIEKCRTRKSGLGLLVEIHVEVDGDLTVRRGHDIGHEVSDYFRKSALSIQHVVAYMEPTPAVNTNTPVATQMAGREQRQT